MKSAAYLAIAAALAASGCSILREPPAEQLYRLNSPSPAPTGPRGMPSVRLALEQGVFPREAEGVRILSTDGAQVSYLAGARWAAPASGMFEAALLRAFAARPDAGLYPRGVSGGTSSLLRVDVTQFEAAYDQGPAAAPIVRVRASGRVIQRLDRAVQGQREFYAEQRASDNRVSAVVEAYDAAVGRLTEEVAVWGETAARR